MGGSAAETWVGSSAEERAEEQAVAAVQAWSIGALAGRLVEVTHRGAGTAMTWAAELLWQAQQAGEPTAWICT